MTFDPATLDMLGREVVRPPFLAWLDIVDDPIRATTWEVSLRLSGTGDPDLDGQLFSAISPELGSVSGVKRATGGSDTVTATLSGIVGPNSDLLNILADETKWKGRLARLWFLTLNSAGDRVGAVVPYYTGRMVGFVITGSADQQTAKITIESYLASLTAASNRTYLDQADFVPNDTSASLTLAVANGAKTA
ncbi:MAG: hypothetical protein IIZ30_15070 [Sphingomonas sp.]|uniref:hypothetical protein n=1 Tax=Sphingomonas sp. TaxID=28214 RepID=UPI00257F91AC|nr:hypothetical protein [Sphingomonas sp.]MBQ1481344.1 hypothetical protein [Sphingomonas sp.]